MLTFLGIGLLCAAAVAQGQESDKIQFRLIAGGRFIQGTTGGERVLQRAFPLSTAGQNFGNAEGPAHVTWITKPFAISVNEVTVAQFRKFVDETGYETSAERGLSQMVGWQPTPEDKPLYQSRDFERTESFSWKDPGFSQDDDHPVVGVSWNDAKAYCRWLSEIEGVTHRLPTEAEWELVCRAGTSSWFSFGDRAKGVVHQHANFGNVELEKHRRHAAERQWLLDWENDPEDGYVFTAPVGSYQPNAWGVADMHGNVWEWCEDLWLDTVYKDYNRPRYDQPTGIAVDPVNTDRPQTPTNQFHTIRGGCWYNGDLFCRSAIRSYWDADDAACYIGFRVVRDVPANQSTTARESYEAEKAAFESIRAAGGSVYSSRGIDLEVRFAGKSVDESVIDVLGRLENLRKLRIEWRDREAKISQDALNAIAQLDALRSLEFQSDCKVNELDLSVLTSLENLQTLRFSRSEPLGDRHLKSMAGFHSLVEFECYGTAGGLTDVGIGCLGGNRNLQSLKVWENEATGRYLEALQDCPLHTLASTAPYSSEGMLDDNGARRLARFPGMISLTLDGQKALTRDTMEVIGRLSKLEELSLQRCTGIIDAGFDATQNLTRLKSIRLGGTRAGDIAAAAIATIPRVRRVQIGGVDHDDAITDKGVASLSAAFSIEELELTSNVISDESIKLLGRVNRLEELTITSDRVTGSGLGPICQLPELRDLSLRTPSLTDVAFDHLCAAKSILKLRLAHQGVKPPSELTNEGMMKMATSTWMREIWLPRNGTGITEDQIKLLQSKMPKTGVIPYTVVWK